jgi:hypothetical protein
MTERIGNPAWVEAFAAFTRAAVVERYGSRQSCVVSTRVAVEVANYFGLSGRALPVTVAAWNDRWGVGTGGTGELRDGGVWDGHLVLILGERWLVDLAADQFDRTARGLRVPGPAVLSWNADTEALVHSPVGWTNRFEAGQDYTLIRYTALASTVWRSSPDWTNRVRMRPVVGHAIRMLRAWEGAGGERPGGTRPARSARDAR